MFEFDRVVNGGGLSKRVFEGAVRRNLEEMFCGRTTGIVLMGNHITEEVFSGDNGLPVLITKSLF